MQTTVTDQKITMAAFQVAHLTKLQVSAVQQQQQQQQLTYLTYLGDLMDSCGNVMFVSKDVTGSQIRTHPSSKLMRSELSANRSSCRGWELQLRKVVNRCCRCMAQTCRQ